MHLFEGHITEDSPVDTGLLQVRTKNKREVDTVSDRSDLRSSAIAPVVTSSYPFQWPVLIQTEKSLLAFHSGF
jgi:hypothetical protein